MRVLVIDNYDSFTYNLVQYVGELGAEPIVYRNDTITPDEAAELGADRMIISPGPGRPESAGHSMDYVRRLQEELPILGVCLGHQVIAAVYGATVDRAPEPRHGKISPIVHDGLGIFAGLSNPFDATRYHSLAVIEGLPDEIVVTAHSEDGVVQGLRHRDLPLEGVQFHPESVMTEEGKKLLGNFLFPSLVGRGPAASAGGRVSTVN